MDKDEENEPSIDCEINNKNEDVIRNRINEIKSNYKASSGKIDLTIKNDNANHIIDTNTNILNDKLEEETKNYVDDLKKGTYNILVAIRARPLNIKEIEFNDKEIIKILDEKVVILLDPFEYNGPQEVFKNRSREQHYAFDYAFDKYCSQVLLN